MAGCGQIKMGQGGSVNRNSLVIFIFGVFAQNHIPLKIKITGTALLFLFLGGYGFEQIHQGGHHPDYPGK